MSMTITVEDTATPALKRYMAALRDRRPLHEAMGLAVRTQVMNHLRTVKVPQGNRLGGQSTGFWKEAMESVRSTASDSEATVSISKRGVALQYYGGTVRVKNKPWLTIPINPAAHGKSVAEMGVKFYRFLSKKGNWILATDPDPGRVRKPKTGERPNATRIPRYRGGVPLYLLKKQVTVRPHADVIPTREYMAEMAARAAKSYMGRRLAA